MLFDIITQMLFFSWLFDHFGWYINLQEKICASSVLVRILDFGGIYHFVSSLLHIIIGFLLFTRMFF